MNDWKTKLNQIRIVKENTHAQDIVEINDNNLSLDEIINQTNLIIKNELLNKELYKEKSLPIFKRDILKINQIENEIKQTSKELSAVIKYFKINNPTLSQDRLVEKISLWFNFSIDVEFKGLNIKPKLTEIKERELFLKIMNNIEAQKKEILFADQRKKEKYEKDKLLEELKNKTEKAEKRKQEIKSREEKEIAIQEEKNKLMAKANLQKKKKLIQEAKKLIKKYNIDKCNICDGIGNGEFKHLITSLTNHNSPFLPICEDHFRFTQTQNEEVNVLFCENMSPNCPFCGGMGTFNMHVTIVKKFFSCRYCNEKGLMSNDWTSTPNIEFIENILKSNNKDLIDTIREIVK